MLRFAIIPLSLSLHFIQAHAEKRLEFFESRIRPVLVENCYECHNSIKQGKFRTGLWIIRADCLKVASGVRFYHLRILKKVFF